MSQQRAANATIEGRFANAVVPVLVEFGEGRDFVSHDKGIRQETSTETLATLKPSFQEGKITAGCSSLICNGASAALIMSAMKDQELCLRTQARFHSFAVAGADPITMLNGPILATQDIGEIRSFVEWHWRVRGQVSLRIRRIGVQRETGADLEKINPNSGAIALGQPLGSSGTKLMATLLNELERSGGRYGLQVMCEGGGMANATIVELLA